MAAPDHIPAVFAPALLAIVLAGCPHDDGGLDPCADGSADEVSENECGPEDPGPLGPNECLSHTDPDQAGYRVQCEGEFHSRIDFNVLGLNCEEAIDEEFCSQVYPFGPPFDTYEAPDVMACCGEGWDPVENLGVYQDSCMWDLAAQACASIAIRLEKAIEAGDFKTEYGDFTKKANNLHAYINGHRDQCTAALYEGDADPDPGKLVSHWAIPKKIGPEGWWPAKEIVVSVEAGTSVADVHRPEDQANWLECQNPDDNDDEIFEDQTSPEGDIVVDVALDEGVDGKLLGPVVGGSAVTSSMTFDANCVDQGCPGASWSYRAGSDASFTMEDLRLYTTDFEVTNATRVLSVERARVELWKQAHGTKILARDGGLRGYEIPAGQAWFYVAGMANGIFGRFMAVNSTDIELAAVDGIWTIGSFEIEILDAGDRTWTVTVDDSRWKP